VADVQLQLDRPKVIKTLAGEVAKGDGLWQKFRRDTTVTLRRRMSDRRAAARSLQPHFGGVHQDAVKRVLLLQSAVPPVSFERQINEGMMIEAIDHKYRIQKRIHDQKFLPTTFGQGPQLEAPLRQLLPQRNGSR
jgi:hypothetical protein